MITKLEIAFFALEVIILFILFFWMIRTEKRLKRFFLGKKGKDLEDTIETLTQEIANLKSAKSKTEKELEVVNKKLRQSIRGLETVRFNPFPDQGGRQSFAMSMVNEDGDGVIISSLYARERNSVFAKPVKSGKSEHELSLEEKEVLEKSINHSRAVETN